MICCDTCEEWFHGKCVNITKAQGQAMELKNMTWVCPPCRKNAAEKQKREAAEARITSRRRSETVVQSPVPSSPIKTGSVSTPKTNSPSVRLSKTAAAQQAEAAAAANAAKTASTPAKIAAQSPASTKRLNIRRSDSQPDKSHDGNFKRNILNDK